MAHLQHAEADNAPWIIVPETEVTSIEHPCIVKNRSRAIDMLGGAQSLAQSLEQGTKQSLSLSFKPNDPASRTIMSLHNETDNILLKVTVPKRTGRKRKRGSKDDFVEDSAASRVIGDASHLFASLRDNPDNFNLETVGNIKSCHVWRGIPDFAFFAKTSGFLQDIESHLLPQQYPRLKQWSMPRTSGLENTEVIPPAVFSTQSLSHNYTYRQNPAVKTMADPSTGSKMLLNRSAPVKLHIQIMMFDDPQYPTAPSPDCPPLEEQSKPIQKLVQQVQELFERRPIWTRRALINSLPLNAPTGSAKFAAAYVCYSLRSGPWRDAYCKFGIDPRKDAKYRKYQTILLKLASKDKASLQTRGPIQRLWSRSPDTQSHIFTGKKAVPIDGKTWQMCDLEDPVLKGLVDVPELHLRAECETRYFGWYANGTSAKLRVLLKAKIDALAEGKALDSGMVETFVRFPESWAPKTTPNSSTQPAPGYLSDKSSAKELEWASAYRSICRASVGSLPNYGSNGKGRLSKSKPTVRASYIDPEQDLDPETENPDGAEGQLEDDAKKAVEYEEPEEDEEEEDDNVNDGDDDNDLIEGDEQALEAEYT